MSHDKTLRILNLPSAILFGVIVTLLTDKLAGSLAFILFYIGEQFGRAATPDSDVDDETYQDFFVSFIDPYIHRFWYLFWLPYRKIVPHRNWISHFPIIGTIIRITYLLLPCIALNLFFEQLKPVEIFLKTNWDLTLYFICGIIWTDIIHISMDYILIFRKIVENLNDIIIPK